MVPPLSRVRGSSASILDLLLSLSMPVFPIVFGNEWPQPNRQSTDPASSGHNNKASPRHVRARLKRPDNDLGSRAAVSEPSELLDSGMFGDPPRQARPCR